VFIRRRQRRRARPRPRRRISISRSKRPSRRIRTTCRRDIPICCVPPRSKGRCWRSSSSTRLGELKWERSKFSNQRTTCSRGPWLAAATREPGAEPNSHTTYFEFQVLKGVTPLSGNMPPRYPDMLRSANVEGEVLAQFVVDENGNAEVQSLKILKSTHDLFTA